MTHPTFEVTLCDTGGKQKMFALDSGRNGPYHRPIWTERGFGAGPTHTACIDEVQLSGDVWRFFEGTLGLEALYAHLSKESVDAQACLLDFAEKFQSTSDDEQALLQWNLLLSPSDSADALADAPRG